MEPFAKTVNGFQAFTIFTNRSIKDVWQGSGYAPVKSFNPLMPGGNKQVTHT